MPGPYESELGQFLREMKERDPSIEAGQKQGRAIWWDKNIDRDMSKPGFRSTVTRLGEGTTRTSRLPSSALRVSGAINLRCAR